MKQTDWNPSRASTWLRRYADDLGHDAYHTQDQALYAWAGSAYYAVMNGVGYNTRQEFIDFLRNHVQVSDWFIEEALEEIDGGKAL